MKGSTKTAKKLQLQKTFFLPLAVFPAVFTKTSEFQEEQHNDASMFVMSFRGAAQSFYYSGTCKNTGGIRKLMRGEFRPHRFASSPD